MSKTAVFDLFKSPKTDITFKAWGNHLEGSGNPRAITISMETVDLLSESGNLGFDMSQADIEIKALLSVGARVFIYSTNHYLAVHRQENNIDGLMLEYDKQTSILKFALFAQDGRELIESVRCNLDNIFTAIEEILSEVGYLRIFEREATFSYYGVTKHNYYVPTDGYSETPHEWLLEGKGILILVVENKIDLVPEVSNTNNAVKTQTTNNSGEVKMKVANIVTANKTAAVSVAKVEAGRIAVKQAVKLVKPVVPVIARGYLESALGELAVANLFKFAVDNFAPGNQKAQIVADVMLQGAMLGAIQSLNIEQMISEVLDKVDVSKFADLVKSDE